VLTERKTDREFDKCTDRQTDGWANVEKQINIRTYDGRMKRQKEYWENIQREGLGTHRQTERQTD
jgi:hypothetical protein